MNNATNVYGNSRMPLYLQVAAAMRQKMGMPPPGAPHGKGKAAAPAG